MIQESSLALKKVYTTSSSSAGLVGAHAANIAALTGQAPMGFFHLDTQLRFVYVNDWLAAVHGAPAAAHIGRRHRDIVPHIAEAIEADFRHVLTTGLPVVKQTLLIETAAHPGVRKYYQHSFSPARSADGELVGLNCFVSDIDGWMRAEEQLRTSEARSREAQQMASIGLWEWDSINSKGYWSDELYRLFKEEPGSFEPTVGSLLERVVLEDRERTRAMGEASLKTREACAMEYGILCRDGTRKIVHSQGRVKVDESGRVIGLIGTLRDITEQWLAEERLRASEFRLREAQRMSKLGNWERNVLTGEIWWSEEALRIFGLDPAAQQPDIDRICRAVHADDRQVVIDSIESLIERGEPHSIEYRVVRPDGSERIVHDQAKAVVDGNGRVILLSGTVQDITKRKRVEQALQQSEYQYRTIVDTAHEGIMVINREHRIEYVNRRMAEMLGYEVEEVQGCSNFDFMDESGRQAVQSKVPQRLAGEREQYDFKFRHRDGSSVWTSIAATPMSDKEGVYCGSLLMVADTTERRKLETQLRQAQKMEAVGQLTGGIAHDFNNLLTIVIGNLQLLEASTGHDDALRGQAQAALGAALRGAELTRRLLAFSRRQLLAPKVILINELVTELAPLLRRTLGENISIRTQLSDDLWLTEVDPSQLENALVNLAVNARDAMPEGGKLTIETRNATLADSYPGTHPEVAPGDYILLAVSDNGTGIPKDIIPKVFDPFFSTKETGKGSGLGLSMVHGFVKQSQGDISIYSEEGQGTTVKIFLPRSQSSTRDIAATSTRLEAVPSGSETILLVEDDPGVREIGVSVLRGLGYRILEAEVAADALSLLEGDDNIDLLFTDMIMPGGMSGSELAREARHRYPKLKVLYTSGYTDAAVLEHGLLEDAGQILNKPYQKHELAQRVRAALDQA